MNLLMISGDRSLLQGKQGAFYYTLQELSKHFDRIDIICPHSGTSEASKQSCFFENAYIHENPKGLLSQPKFIQKKGQELIAAYGHRAMTVHDYPPFYNGWGAMLLKKKTGIPYVTEIHHIIGWPVASSWTESIGYRLSHMFLSWITTPASAIRTVNPVVRQKLIDWGMPEEKVQIVPSFYLDADLLSPREGPREYDVVTAARLVENKGLFEFIDALEFLPGVRGLIIGDGPLKERLETYVRKKGMDDRIRLVGWLPTQDDVLTAIQSAAIFVMNSKSEGGPRSALEAMAIGMPIIATPVGIMPQVIEDGVNGLLHSGTPRALAKKIENLLSNDEKRLSLGKNAQKIKEQFERKKLIREYAEFIKATQTSPSI